LKDLELSYFEELKKEIQREYLKNNTPSDDDISKWKGIDITYFQEELRKKAKGNISEKTFYTYFKSSNLDRLPRIDMLNLLSNYVGYDSWYEFKKQHEYIDKSFKKDKITISKTKHTENKIIKEKKNLNFDLRYIIYSVILLCLLFGMGILLSSELLNKTYQFCFTDADRGNSIQNNIDIKIIKENESPIHYKIKAGECFHITTKEKTLKMEVSSPMYETLEIFRNLENAPEIENIALKPDDYALMLYYYSTKDTNNSSLEQIKNKQQKLNHLISEDALIYQIFDNEIYGVETLSKQKYIGLVTTPTKSLQNLKVLATKMENGKIVSIKFKIETNENK